MHAHTAQKITAKQYAALRYTFIPQFQSMNVTFILRVPLARKISHSTQNSGCARDAAQLKMHADHIFSAACNASSFITIVLCATNQT